MFSNRAAFAALGLIAFAVSAVAMDEVKVGSAAPDFSLTDSQGKTRSLAEFKGKYVVLEWKNHGCPYVKKHYNSGNMQRLQKDYTAKGVAWLSIISSAPGKQGYSTPTQANHDVASFKASPTAVLLDTDGKVGKLYGATTTPGMYVINPEGKVIYQGAIDDKPTTEEADVKTATNYVAAALDAAMAGRPITVASTKSYGCGVKYRD
jgi:peroxiredoxin